VGQLVTAFLLAGLVIAGSAYPTSAQTSRPPAAQDEFVPVSELPPTDEMPAAPLVIAAYAVFWLFPFVYLWSLRRRMSAVDRELAELRDRIGAAPER
jgi:CcmD family protein